MTATAPRSKVTRLITEPTLSDLVASVDLAQEELNAAKESARASVRVKEDRLEEKLHALSERMDRDGLDAFTDRRTGKRVFMELRRTFEITDQDRVFAALSDRGRLAECTRLDSRAVKKEAKEAPLAGTTEVPTRRLRVRKAKGV